jgi:hypothetical protein
MIKNVYINFEFIRFCRFVSSVTRLKEVPNKNVVKMHLLSYQLSSNAYFEAMGFFTI